MSEKKVESAKAIKKTSVKDSSTDNSTIPILKKLGHSSSVGYQPYDSLKERYVKLNIKK